MTDQLIVQTYAKVNGAELSPDDLNQLEEVEIDSSFFMPAMATLRFFDQQLKFVDDSRFAIGNALEISVVANTQGGLKQQSPTTVFKGVIAALEPEFTAESSYLCFVVRAYDRSYPLHRGNKSAVYQNETDSGIMQKVVSEAGLSFQGTSTSQVHEHVARDDRTDYEFLSALARRNGFVIYCDDKTIKVKKIQDFRSGTVTLSHGQNLLEFRPLLTSSGQVSEVKVQGWDPKAKATVVGMSSSASNLNQITEQSVGTAARAFGNRSLHLTDFHQNQSSADVYASALHSRLASGGISGEGTCWGDPNIIPGAELDIKNLGTRFSGKYIVTRARHHIGKGIYQTHFTVGGAESGTVASLVSVNPIADAPRTSTFDGLVVAVVTNNKDPENLGRVRLKFPTLTDELESTWARVVLPGAGNDRGLYVMPEVNDEVVVAFGNGDFNQPFVLGGVWNGKDAPPQSADASISGKVDIREWKTRAGHVIRLTDKDGSEAIEIIDKTKQDFIKIDAVAKSITITAKGDVKVEGINVEVNATGQLKLSGASVEVSSKGLTKISGNMVQIN